MINISSWEAIYFLTWLTALAVSSFLILRSPNDYEITSRIYWQFLLQPWKMFTFVVATTLLVLAAPYSGDPTWDTWDSLLTGICTYTTAPWAVGVFYRVYRSRQLNHTILVAVSLFMTSCWSYDFYLLLRDHTYPATWLPNLPISMAIALSAGLFWNLAWHPNHGSCFAFTLPVWPAVSPTPIKKLLLPALIITIPFVYMLLLFVYEAQWASP